MTSKQKQFDYYILKLIGCVEPVLIGTFASEKEAQERLESYQDDPSECQNSQVLFKVTEGAEVEI